jgi:S-adenosylmethionine:tRNA ribosyltransferase-isomerase
MQEPGPRLSDFDYRLPPERIAQEPVRPRDASRLMVLDRAGGGVRHRRFCDLPDLLAPDDLVVLNDTRVIPAAFTAQRVSGGRIEGCFLRDLGEGTWEVLLSGRGRLREGEALDLAAESGGPAGRLTLLGRGEAGVWHVRPPPGTDTMALLWRVGRPPLPPYIRRRGADPARRRADRDDYQTIYARHDGAVAAPTAGLHFTPAVLDALAARNIERTFITLHVGLGTFQPMRSERLAEHRMHAEAFEVSAEAAAKVAAARVRGGRVVAVGTTTVRAMESAATGARGVEAGAGWTDLFIRPPFEFRVADALVTNFHLPRTTLLAMVCAFAGRERVLAAYEEAIREGYRFYSYGDAMLIL